ncbi:MAG TPA: CPBP family intramembrane glutamic endopeptidase [Anaerolineales bacterium]|nr:CPBP family intramembrane glutamic endopeptidase [Anaerolineales bacterium]
MSTLSIPASRESGVRAFIKRHSLLSMYLVMFALAWSVMIPQALYTQGILSAPLPSFLEILTGWAPGIAAFVVSAVVAGRAGVRDLLGRFLIWRVGVQWYLIAVFLLALLMLGGIGLHIAFGGEMPYIPAAGAPAWDIALTFVLFVLLGFLINWEEVAWRGFALPRLQVRYGALLAALLITVPEVLLHVPLYWIEDSFIRSVGIGWFSAFSVAAVIIYIYVFNRTRGSLLIVTLLHASQNAWSNLLSDNSPRPFYFTVLLIWVIALLLVASTRGRLGYPADSSRVE